ncbi:HSP20-like chaperone, partial [Morchella conica CCBAS932]
RTVFTPRFDVQETAVEYVLEGEFPGLSNKSKLDIQFTDHKTLSVRGVLEKKVLEQNKSCERPSGPAPISTKKIVIENTPTNKVKTWVSERAFGPFQRTFSFPGVIDIEDVSASLEAGLLRIRVPKKTQLTTRKITIV